MTLEIGMRKGEGGMAIGHRAETGLDVDLLARDIDDGYGGTGTRERNKKGD